MKNLLLIFTLCLVGCSSNPYKVQVGPNKAEISGTEKNNYHNLVGKWFGSRPLAYGEHVYWIVVRSIDGTYQINSRYINNEGEIDDVVSVGDWGSSGQIYFSIRRGFLEHKKFVAIDPTDPQHKDAYKIINIDENRFQYQGLSTGTIFEVVRVDSDFKMPDQLPEKQ